MVTKIVSIPCIVDGEVCIITKDFTKRPSRKHKKLSPFKLMAAFILAGCIFSTIPTAKTEAVVEPQETFTEQGKVGNVALQPTEVLDLLETIAPTLEELQNVPQEVHSAEFTVTAYCSCEKCCGSWAKNRQGPVVGAAGTELIPDVSVAVDNSIFSFGTVFTDPQGHEFIAADTGSGVEGYWLDIYMEDHEVAKQWGKQKVTLTW